MKRSGLRGVSFNRKRCCGSDKARHDRLLVHAVSPNAFLIRSDQKWTLRTEFVAHSRTCLPGFPNRPFDRQAPPQRVIIRRFPAMLPQPRHPPRLVRSHRPHRPGWGEGGMGQVYRAWDIKLNAAQENTV